MFEIVPDTCMFSVGNKVKCYNEIRNVVEVVDIKDTIFTEILNKKTKQHCFFLIYFDHEKKVAHLETNLELVG
jgi:hypothetical protein